jgi:hypothetical protein
MRAALGAVARIGLPPLLRGCRTLSARRGRLGKDELREQGTLRCDAAAFAVSQRRAEASSRLSESPHCPIGTKAGTCPGPLDSSPLSPQQRRVRRCRFRSRRARSRSPNAGPESRRRARCFVNAEVSGGSHEVPDLLTTISEHRLCCIAWRSRSGRRSTPGSRSSSAPGVSGGGAKTAGMNTILAEASDDASSQVSTKTGELQVSERISGLVIPRAWNQGPSTARVDPPNAVAVVVSSPTGSVGLVGKAAPNEQARAQRAAHARSWTSVAVAHRESCDHRLMRKVARLWPAAVRERSARRARY